MTLKNPVFVLDESFDHPFSYVKFEYYVQDNYGILDNEVSNLWASNIRNMFMIFREEIERKRSK